MAKQFRERYAGGVAGALAAATLLLSTILVSVAQASDQGTRSAVTPQHGGSYSLWLSGAPDCLDPQKTAAANSDTVDSYVFDSLLSINQKGHYVGDLATKYKISNHGLRITFTLRRGIRFSNGDPFTAAAVKYTVERALNPATKSPATAALLTQVKDVKTPNNYTAVFDLNTPSRPLLTNLASVITGILDPKATRVQGANSCQTPVGTGPYKIRSTGTAFSNVTLVANKYHNFAPSWIHNKGTPYISKVVFETIPSDSTAISELLSGGIDVASIPGSQLSRVKSDKNIVRHRQATNDVAWISFNTAHPPFNNPQVRKAVAELIDRKAIIRAALGGLGRPLYSPLAPTIPFYNKNAGKYMPKLDPAGAAAIIAANHANGPYTLLVPNGAEFQTMAEIIQAAAGQAGMKLNVVSKDIGSYIAAAANGGFDIDLLDYNYDDPDVLSILLGKGGSLSWGGYQNTRLNTLFVQGRETLNNKNAAKIYSQIQNIINQQAIFIAIENTVGVLGMRSDIKGYHTNSQGGIAVQDLYIKSKK